MREGRYYSIGTEYQENDAPLRAACTALTAPAAETPAPATKPPEQPRAENAEVTVLEKSPESKSVRAVPMIEVRGERAIEEPKSVVAPDNMRHMESDPGSGAPQNPGRLFKVFAIQIAAAFAILALVYSIKLIPAAQPVYDLVIRAFSYNPEPIGVADKDIGKLKFVDGINELVRIESADTSAIILPVSEYELEYYGGVAYLTTGQHEIYASMDGVVEDVARSGNFINVCIKYGKLTTVTGMDYAGVKIGESVKAGQRIGLNVGGGAVMFSILKDGEPLDLSQILV